MKTIGDIFKEARFERGVTLEKLEKETKIKKEFIARIENGSWNKLPAFPVVLGFVKNLASALEIDEGKALAFLRRDYPSKTAPILPPKDVEKKFTWGPKLTFIIGICLVLIIILGYLGFQYISFIKPPRLDVFEPQDNLVVNSLEVDVSGRTDPDASLSVNNQPLLLDSNGGFSHKLEISDKTDELVFLAESRSGKTTYVKRKIIVELKKN